MVKIDLVPGKRTSDMVTHSLLQQRTHSYNNAPHLLHSFHFLLCGIVFFSIRYVIPHHLNVFFHSDSIRLPMVRIQFLSNLFVTSSSFSFLFRFFPFFSSFLLFSLLYNERLANEQMEIKRERQSNDRGEWKH